MDYEFIEKCEGQQTFGINWLDDEDNILETEWFETEEARQVAIDKWYADLNRWEPEQ